MREEILHNHLQEMMILLMSQTLIFRRGHWFSLELEGVMFVILFLQHNLIAIRVLIILYLLEFLFLYNCLLLICITELCSYFRYRDLVALSSHEILFLAITRTI